MEALGIDLRTLVFDAISFILLLAGLTYFLYKPLQKLLNERKSKVDDSLRAAEKLREEVAANQLLQEKSLDAARAEAQLLIQEARDQAKSLSARLEIEAKQHRDQLVAQAKKEAEEEKSRAHRELREELVQTILTTTEKVLGSDTSTPDRIEQTHRLVQNLHP